LKNFGTFLIDLFFREIVVQRQVTPAIFKQTRQGIRLALSETKIRIKNGIRTISHVPETNQNQEAFLRS